MAWNSQLTDEDKALIAAWEAQPHLTDAEKIAAWMEKERREEEAEWRERVWNGIRDIRGDIGEVAARASGMRAEKCEEPPRPAIRAQT
jgi:hypothetical protein